MSNTNEKPINITEKAIEQVLTIQSKDQKLGQFLRISVVGGGCSGLSYKLDFSNEKKEKDLEIDYQQIKVLVDPKSLLFLKNMNLDFTDGLNGQGFVFSNPNAKQTCGCGSSFAA